LFLPDRLDPALEAIASRAGLDDLGGKELGRDFEPPNPSGDDRYAAADELPQIDIAAGIGERHVEDAIELIAETGENEGDGPDARPQQMSIRRALIGALFLSESRALEKGEDCYGNVTIALAGASSGREIAAAFFRMPLQILG